MGSADNSINLDNVQGDILLGGLPKNNESFYFFQINDDQVKPFCAALRQLASTDVTHLSQAASDRDAIRNSSDGQVVNTVGVNIAFSFAGLQKLSTVLASSSFASDVAGRMQDNEFQTGMLKSNPSLEDPIKDGVPDYIDAFRHPEKLHGVILVAGSDANTVANKLHCLKSNILGHTVTEIATISGNVRPGKMRGHEHFGFKDGISQPSITGIDTNIPPGQDQIDPGVILCNRSGDPHASLRPSWMTDGSFLCFRQLEQKVPEWNKFLVDSSNTLGTWSDQLGARLIGRWKSGCPVTASPDFDNTAIGADPLQNNQVDFVSPSSPDANFKCPLGAHIRKMNPRGDIGRSTVNQFRILRRGIPYGPEVDVDQSAERGLLFVCYQSTLSNGFAFLQRTWANNANFVQAGAGLDASIGQSNEVAEIEMKGLFPQDKNRGLLVHGVNRFVVPKGGEYFFAPSMSTLRGVLSETK